DGSVKVELGTELQQKDNQAVAKITSEELNEVLNKAVFNIDGIKKIVLDRYGEELKKSKYPLARAKMARINYLLAKDYLSIGRIKEARKHFWKAFINSPFKVEYLARFFRTLLKNG
ncbi:MAG: hypothetical protein N2Z79_02400, partial [Candidatus Omnitrophica bacterium]|nr:hypothetical protein [Candidatus Omnitrophota bacterium]